VQNREVRVGAQCGWEAWRRRVHMSWVGYLEARFDLGGAIQHRFPRLLPVRHTTAICLSQSAVTMGAVQIHAESEDAVIDGLTRAKTDGIRSEMPINF
jgi:hypothetical protein